MINPVTAAKLAERPRGAAPPPCGQEISVTAVTDVEALEAHVGSWENLAAAAIEPNVFQEPWMLLPALRRFAAGQELLFLLASAPDPARPQGPPLLCGLLALERRRRYKGLPLPHLALWRHLHAVLSTPLIRTGRGPETLHALFEWLRQHQQGSGLLELGFVSADGPFHHLLVDHLNECRRLTYVEETTTRGLLRVGEDGEAYLCAAMSGSSRKKLAQKRRRLADLGAFESRTLPADGDLEPWIKGFLELEASGWKGRQGTALAIHENERNFFECVAREAFARKRLMMLGLFLENEPVALKCNFLMGHGSVAFKIAFDEEHARFSPGLLLEVDNILQAHARQGLKWMDSCAVSRAVLFDRLWTDRRIMQTVLVSTGRRMGDLAVSTLPLLRWLQRLLRRESRA